MRDLMKVLNTLLLLFLFSCAESSSRDYRAPNIATTDTYKGGKEPEIDTTFRSVPAPDSISQEIDQDTVLTGFVAFDNLRTQMKRSERLISSAKSFCWGDCCGSYWKYFDKATNTTLYITKSYCGDYGNSNGQYLFNGNKLLGVHTYEYSAEVDTSSISEKAYFFLNEQVLLKERVLTSSNYVMDFGQNPFLERNVERGKTVTMLNKQLHDFLALKNEGILD
jgi:hypothetical protein